MSFDSPNRLTWKQKLQVVGTVTGAGILGFACYRYKIARPNEYLVRTGLGLRDINVVKTGFQWPFQRMTRLSMVPKNYSFRLQAMSNEKMEFVLPGVFTVGPRDDTGEALIRYSRFLMGTSEDEQKHIIMGLIEGETRALAASSSIEQIFQDRSNFRDKITENIGHELDKFGLQIFNANVKELEDAEGSEYFQYLRQRTKEGAANQAKVDVAQAKYLGDVGAKERERSTRIETAQFESEAVTQENQRNIEISQSHKDREVREAEFQRESRVAQIESQKAAAIREAELQKQVEEVTQKQMTAELRAKLVSDATAQAEAKVKEAEGHAQAVQIKAEADLFAQQKHAEGIQAIYEAQAQGVQQVMESIGDVNGFLNYEMIQKNLYPELAQINSQAIRGLNPKITVWTTGSSSDQSDYTKTIRDVAQCVPPLFSTIQDQTGMKLPDWLMKQDPPAPALSTKEDDDIPRSHTGDSPTGC